MNMAKKGCHAVTFSEKPTKLNYPSLHGRHWDPFWQACSDENTIVNLHIGSSSSVVITSVDAPVECEGVRIGAHGDVECRQIDLTEHHLYEPVDTAGSSIHFFGRLTDSSGGKKAARSWCWIEWAPGLMTPEILDFTPCNASGLLAGTCLGPAITPPRAHRREVGPGPAARASPGHRSDS